MKSLEILLSKERLQSYASLSEHFENLALIGRLAPKLLLIEICLRNITNDILLHQGGFAKQELLNALKKDRDTIIEKIQNKEKDWIPSYKMLHQKNVEKEQELNYN
ncbi:hypothetical protein [Campylobacter helveticus]|uniref:Uncharacterized protein n=1 Tax=Campylobacter helveticus TaxID=28898 RepID=A0AAX2UIP1_9BACT|nr:hypothetical protein [Campylobacter helveticus]ARE81470.1 hypothetical protein CHELV3228_b0006 [Campylobacter helveticus]MCR2054986.1 hypothetical protein [Campylobacter helveticus]TNB57496.1 hypothetical protein FDW42_04980 [Campylobacter helveticus]TNB61324.1 hypothetical protein FDW43_08760 [Campylobacter helveticus]TNH32441.1 hypothetical protein FDW48_07045 [Campylobacter helveticus]